jgi:hypothetical protein
MAVASWTSENGCLGCIDRMQEDHMFAKARMDHVDHGLAKKGLGLELSSIS